MCSSFTAELLKLDKDGLVLLGHHSNTLLQMRVIMEALQVLRCHNLWHL